jgi:hypothetical protein
MTIDIHEEVNAETEDAMEESPCNRWHCRNEKVNHMSGIDVAYLAMDIEEGVEVIWNEIIFQEEYKSVFLENEAGIRKNLDALKNLAHPNILKVSSRSRMETISSCDLFSFMTTGSKAWTGRGQTIKTRK